MYDYDVYVSYHCDGKEYFTDTITRSEFLSQVKRLKTDKVTKFKLIDFGKIYLVFSDNDTKIFYSLLTTKEVQVKQWQRDIKVINL